MPPTPEALSGAVGKVNRAKQHLLQLGTMGKAIAEANRNNFRHQDDTNTGQRSIHLIGDPIVPEEYALIAGDITHNLRSALDHVAWALCVAGPRGRAGITDNNFRSILFPTCQGTANDHKALRARREIAALAKPGAVDVIDAAEPYTGGAGEILSIIAALDNVDKHRLLITIALQPPAINIGPMVRRMMMKADPDGMSHLAGTTAFDMWIPAADQTPLKAGDKVTGFPIDSEANHEMPLLFPVSLNEPEIVSVQPIVDLMQKMSDTVDGLIPHFALFV